MRRHFVAPIFGALCAACTAYQAQENTLRLGATVGSIETRQIAETLALFIEDPDRIPYMVTLSTGQTNVQAAVAANWQVNSVASAVVSATQNTHQRTLGFGPPLTGQYTDQWQMNAINDPDDLAHLRCMFSFPIRKALGQIDEYENFKVYKASYNCGEPPDIHDRPRGARKDASPPKLPVRYQPPDNPFLMFRHLGSEVMHGKLQCRHPHDPVLEIGTVNGYELRVCRLEYHDFELAILGASLNTKGGTTVTKDKKGNPVLLRVPPKTLQPQILSIPPPIQ